MTKTHAGTIAAVLVLAGTVLATSARGAQAPDPKLIDAGRKLFTSDETGPNCVKCHSAGGVGNDKLPMERLTKMPVQDIRKWITSPAEMTAKLKKKPQVPMKKIALTPAQVDALAAFVLSVQQ